MPSGRTVALLLLGAGLTVATFLWPAAALVIDAGVGHEASASAPSVRQIDLLWRGTILASQSAIGGMALGAALASGMLARRAWLRWGSHALAWFTLLTPTYLIAYAWSLPLLPAGLPIGAAASGVAPNWLTRDARAILCLSIWLSPLAALLLADAWRGAPSRAYRQALLDAGAGRAARTGLLLMRRAAISLFVLLLAIASAEYAIPHLCLRPTWNTELLAQLQLREQPALLPAWPGLLANAALIVLWQVVRAGPRFADAAMSDLAAGDAAPLPTPRSATIAALIAWGLLASPTILLIRYLQQPRALWQVWSIYADDWVSGAGYALLGALFAALLAALWSCLASGGGAGRGAAAGLFAIAALFAIAPPAIVGEGHLLAAGSAVGLRDSLWPIALLGAARFCIVPLVLCGNALRELRGSGLLDSAAVDGAARDAAFWSVVLPRLTGPLLVGAIASGVLTFGEIAGSILVIPPGVGSVARSLLNEIHFGRNDDVIALSLWTLALAALTALPATWLGERGVLRAGVRDDGEWGRFGRSVR